MYEYVGGGPAHADYEAANYGISASDRSLGKYFIVSDSYYSTLSSKFSKAYNDLADAIESYRVELNDIAASSVLSGEFHNSLVDFAGAFDGLSEKLTKIGSSYKVLCKQFLAEVEDADEDLYEKGCDPRDYSNDAISYYIDLIEDTKGYIGGSRLQNLINNVFENLKNLFFSLSQKKAIKKAAPDFQYTKEYRQALLDKLNYDKKDMLLIQDAEIEIDKNYEEKFGELYDSVIAIKEIVDKAKDVVEKGLSHDSIVALYAAAGNILIHEYVENQEEEITVEQVEQYCANEENRDVFNGYSDELDKARKSLGIEEGIYAGIATGISQAKLEVFGGDIPDQIAPSERYSYLLLKKQLAETIGNMAGNPVDISEYEKEELYKKIHRAINGDYGDMPEWQKKLIEGLVKKLREKSVPADYMVECIEKAILPAFYDYSKNIKIIQSLANGVDPSSMLGIAVDDLLNEYTDGFSAAVGNFITYVEEQITSKVEKKLEDIIVDGLNSCVSNGNVYVFMAKKAAELSGINDIGNDAMKLYSLYESNEQLLNSYKTNFDIVASGNYTEVDVENLKNSFEIIKDTFKEEFSLAANIAGNEGNHDNKRYYKDLCEKVDKMSMTDFL